MLFLFELKKLLLTKRGLFILLGCLFLKAVFLFVFPEQIDSRIRLSRKQYDRYLETIYGEDTEEKNAQIREEYAACKAVIAALEATMEKYRAGELSEEEWSAYSNEYEDALLHINSLEIFYEKAVRFGELEETYPDMEKPYYVDESGWQTVYTLQKFPDVFLLVFVLLMAVLSFSSEASSGMLPVLMSASKGREELFLAKACVLALVSILGSGAGCLMEALIFRARGFFADGGVPLYSISVFGNTAYHATLSGAYASCLAVRILVMAAFGLAVLGISVWLRRGADLITVALLLLVLPALFIQAKASVFSYTVLLSGTRLLALSAANRMPLWFPAAETGLVSLAAMLVGMVGLV